MTYYTWGIFVERDSIEGCSVEFYSIEGDSMEGDSIERDSGLDHRIGHLALMRPQKNEQPTPIEVETKRRPRHPEPSSIKGEG